MFVTLKVKAGRELLESKSALANQSPNLPLFDDRPERDLEFLMQSSGVMEDIQESHSTETDSKPFLKRVFGSWLTRLL